MAIENKYGKSAVDATRKNALPPYLDLVFEDGFADGRGVIIKTVNLLFGEWTINTTDNNWYQTVVVEEVGDSSIILVFPDQEKITTYLSCGIFLSEEDSYGNNLIFCCSVNPYETPNFGDFSPILLIADGNGESDNPIIIDTALSLTSTNPVQNKVIATALNTKAPLVSPNFTGTPTAPTQIPSTEDTSIATTEFVHDALTSQLNSLSTELKSYADQAEADAISTASTNTDSKISAKIGNLGSSDTTVKTYVDTADTELSDRISELEGNITGPLGELAYLDEVAKTNLTAELQTLINNKADKATTLSGYGITDAYSISQADLAIDTAKQSAITSAKSYTDQQLTSKIGQIESDVKTYVDNKDSALSGQISSINNTLGTFGDIVTYDASQFDTAGAANAVLGTPDDTSSSNTVYGTKAAINGINSTIQGIQTSLGEKVSSIVAADNSVTIGGTAIAPSVAVKIDPDESNNLTLTNAGLKVATPSASASEYTIIKEATATEGYFASYTLQKDGVQVGTKIDIPKDFLIKSASIKDSAGEGDPSGLPAGTKYIDFVVNTYSGSGTESHIYLNVEDLVDAYTAGNGVTISGQNEISLNVVAANGLSVSSSGLSLSLASTSQNGALSSTDKAKIDSIEQGAQVNDIESISLNNEQLQVGEKNVNIPLATLSRVGVVKGSSEINVGTDGTMSITTVNINKLYQDEGDLFIINCGTSVV